MAIEAHQWPPMAPTHIAPFRKTITIRQKRTGRIFSRDSIMKSNWSRHECVFCVSSVESSCSHFGPSDDMALAAPLIVNRGKTEKMKRPKLRRIPFIYKSSRMIRQFNMEWAHVANISFECPIKQSSANLWCRLASNQRFTMSMVECRTKSFGIWVYDINILSGVVIIIIWVKVIVATFATRFASG